MEPLDLVFVLVAILGIIFLISMFVTVQQGNIAVVTVFGKYRRVLRPGLNLRVPLIEKIYSRISIQNRSVDLSFQATTIDQANVNFKAMLLYAVVNHNEETIKNVAFKFVDQSSFTTALVRTIEGSIRSFVATKKQPEILSLRTEIVLEVKHQLDQTLEGWGYHLIDLQLNDIAFDDTIMKSMARVVASHNLRAAAENEGQALLITKTKAAEAEGNAIKIAAEAERIASQLRGQGVALFREEVAKGISHAAKEMEEAHLDSSFILFSMWTESIRHFAEQGEGNMIFLDGSSDNMKRTIQELMGISKGISGLTSVPEIKGGGK